ncbi:MAG: hypothetical protein FJW40_27135 [Acidobacteria bacterium]|nr:hypothetical protein [Acidobacteriota bacterium]
MGEQLTSPSLTKHIEWQAGVGFARQLYPRNSKLRAAFEQIAGRFICEQRWEGQENEDANAFQRMVAEAVRTIVTKDSRRGPNQLARFVVRAALEVGRRNKTGKSRSLAYFNNPARCQKIIRAQLRLRRVKPEDKQRIARFHCVFQAIIMSEELHDGLLLLLSSSKPSTKAKASLRTNLESFFRHVVAPQAHPSQKLSVKDIILLAEKNISDAEIEGRLLAFRKQQGLTLPHPPHKPAKEYDRRSKGSPKVIIRRVRAELRDDRSRGK